MTTFLVTVSCALLCGFVGGKLHEKGKRKRRPSLVSYRKEPDPVWAKWAPEIGRAIGGRKDWR